MKKFYFLSLSLLMCFVARVSFGQTVTFIYTGSSQTYTVPAGVTMLGVDAYGGGGGGAYNCCTAQPHALGGRVQCTLNVTPGSTLYIYVGGVGGSYAVSTLGGFNGGANSGGTFCAAGGGGTDIRTSASGSAYTGRLVVAGGGGGGGDFNAAGGVGGGLIGGSGAAYCCGGAGSGGTQVGGGSGGSGTGSLGVGGSAGGSSGGGGGGYWGGGGGLTESGGGGGSSYTDPVLCSGVIHTQGYSAASGNGQLILTVLCTSPGSIVGSTPVCPGSSITLTNPTATGGTWLSSNTSIATINAATGVLTGVAPGTVTVTYQEANPCGGVSATTSVTVLPLPGPITGTTSACVGNTTTLSDAGGGTWLSSNPSVAAVSPSGVVTGITAGTALISYTLPTGCAPSTTTVTIYPTPAAIGGIPTVCAAGATTTLTDALTGGSWTSGSTSVATVGVGSGVVTGGIPGTSSITYTSANGCVISETITVNPLPAAIAGTTSVCVGSTTTLSDPVSGGTWSSSNTSQVTIGVGTGIATGISAGTPNIIYTLASTGCHISTPIVVNSLPAAISGGSNTCVGGSLTLTDGGGGTWTSSNLLAATINTFTGVLTGVGPGTTTITYSLTTGCSITSSILVNPVPTAYLVTGGGAYCAGGTGVHIGLSYASTGVGYTLLMGGSPVSLSTPGSNSGLDFGLYTSPGIYTVSATNSVTGCTVNMTGSVTVSVNPLPAIHNITGGGGYCVGGAGSPLGTDGSDMGINYQLFNGATAVGPVYPGSGLPLSFGSYTATGTYTVMATNATTGCSQIQGSSATISVTAAPTLYTVTGGGGYCAGGTGAPINLSGSDAGTTYQVFLGSSPVGSPVLSSGGSLNFGLFTAAGTYTVIATNVAGCTAIMTGSVTIIINPLPAVNTVTGGGSYCAGSAGVHVGLSYSTPGINYTLIYGGGVVVTVGGSGSGLDFGAQTVTGMYTVQATNVATGCVANMFGNAVITMNPLPDGSFIVNGGGNYCAGTSGSDIFTSNSEGGVNYQLYLGTTAVGISHGGTGSSIDFGDFTSVGTYTVLATNAVTGCSIMLTGSATVGINPLPALHNVTGGGSYCSGGAGPNIMLNGSNSGVSYQLLQSGSIITTLSGTGSPLNFGTQSVPGVYTVIAIDGTTSCTRAMIGSATVSVNPLPVIDTVTGGGSLCSGGTGFPVYLSGSTPGVNYQLYNGGVSSGAALSGTGSILNFGLKTVNGSYTITATNPLTGCTSTMSGSAIINVSALPIQYNLTGGGNYCLGGSGQPINLSGSDLNVNYQLYRDGVPVGASSAGVSGLLSFGIDTFGTYTAKGTDGTTGCTSNMLGTVTINTVTPTVYTLTGGGAYCSGGTGVLVNLSGSTPGIKYQLVTSGSSSVGLPLSGTGLPLSYGLITGSGSYSVIATDTLLGCVGNMAGSAVVVVNSLPVAQTVTGGGSYCPGGSGEIVGLSSSVSGISYQLQISGVITGSPISGTTGLPLNFGLQTTPGAYTVTAVNTTTGCGNTMTGSVSVSLLPAPVPYAVTIDNSGNYCASDSGLHIGLINSQTGVTYQLFRGSTIIGSSVSGHTGTAITFGLESIAGVYSVSASLGSCVTNMPASVTLNIIPLPTAHTVTGGGGFCAGGTGVAVGINGSDAGISYQLYRDTSALGTMYGTGSSINFGLQTTPGTYTVIGNSDITPCANSMIGNARVYYDTMLTPVVSIEAFPGNGVGISQVDSIKVLVTNGGSNPSYQWYVNGNLIAGATSSTFAGMSYFNGDMVTCTVTASGLCGGNSASASITVSLLGVSVKQVIASGADIRLIPNPNNGSFSLKGTLGSALNETLVVEITNMLGQVIYTGQIQAVNGNIDQKIALNNITNGVYLLNLGSGTERSVFHFVIEQ